MWFKKTYTTRPIGTHEAMDMYNAFQRFYDKEKHDHPDDATELAMFGNGSHYFHSRSHYHLEFFIGCGCESCEKPSHAVKFWFGDEKFAAHISESFSKK